MPLAEDDAQAERVHSAISEHCAGVTGFKLTDRRIFSLDHVSERRKYKATVGEPHELLYGEPVIAILESRSAVEFVYLICSSNRGVIRGGPFMAGGGNVSNIVYFDAQG